MSIFNNSDTIKDCRRCKLRENATQVVVGCGNINADIMIIGEAPGVQEDSSGKAFCGKSGMILRNRLKELNYDVDKDFYITNVVKCRPPGNRNPSKTEIKHCAENTEILIDTVNPLLIIAAGMFASNYFLSVKNIEYSAAVGNVFKINDRYIYVMRHPAYALYKGQSGMDEVISMIDKIPIILKDIKSNGGKK